MQESSKNFLYNVSLSLAKTYWKIFKPRTRGARIVLVAQGKILLVRHRGNSFYNLPGGGIRKNEHPEQGALRELFEETKIKIPRTDYLLGEYENNFEGKRDVIFIFVRELETRMEPDIGFELSDAQWFDLKNLKNVSAATKTRIEEYRKGSRNLNNYWIKQGRN